MRQLEFDGVKEYFFEKKRKIRGPDWPIYYWLILILLLCLWIRHPDLKSDAWTFIFDLAVEGMQVVVKSVQLNVLLIKIDTNIRLEDRIM
uniref:Uncharacterized protein n=1 Tax=Romanomermis culicivorax TaxID=13658 RepID=A0A915L6X9_ROMCU